MKTILPFCLLLAAASIAGAQGLNDWNLAHPDNVKPVAQESLPAYDANPRFIAGGARVYIAPMNGFEIYLAAAMEKKGVNLMPVADPEKAEYIISGVSDQTKPGWARWLVTGNSHTDDSATVQMVSKKSSAIVFAYAVNKKYTLHGQQTAAEACAKHLEARIEGRE